VVRVRSDVTGANASQPEFVVPDVFERQRTQRLVISYDASTVRVGVDDPLMIAELDLLPATFPLLELFTDDIRRLRFSSVGDEMRRASLAIGMFGAWMSCLAISYGSGRVGRRWLFASVVPVACVELVLSRSGGTGGIAAGFGARGAISLGAVVLVLTSALGLTLRARRTRADIPPR
jgi:hypothetical protein